MARDQAPDRIAAAVAAPLGTVDLDVDSVVITPAGKRRLLRVAVDKDGGVTLDDIAEATKIVSATLDEQGLMGEGSYTLEVSSPGVDRPLTLPRHWRRNIGRLVKVTTTDNETISGRITSTDERAAEVDVNGKPRSLAYGAVAKAKIQIEFNRTEGDET